MGAPKTPQAETDVTPCTMFTHAASLDSTSKPDNLSPSRYGSVGNTGGRSGGCQSGRRTQPRWQVT
eukprot:364469-Chlamydomonas_euryale.AAC.8